MTLLLLLAALMQPPTTPAPSPPPIPEVRTSDLPHLNIERLQPAAFRSDEITLELKPKGQVGARLEYKVHMKAGDVMVYSVAASGPVINDFHGQADMNDAVLFYREEKAATATNGQFIAPTIGIHGWYLANTTERPVTVKIRIAGYYELTPGLIPINRP